MMFRTIERWGDVAIVTLLPKMFQRGLVLEEEDFPLAIVADCRGLLLESWQLEFLLKLRRETGIELALCACHRYSEEWLHMICADLIFDATRKIVLARLGADLPEDKDKKRAPWKEAA